MAGITFDPEKFQLNFARLKKGGHVFEIAIDPDAALAFRDGKEVELEDILQYDKIFMDVQKGLLASEGAMIELFNTKETTEVAKIILDEGEVHLTTEYKKELRQKKHKLIVQQIHVYGTDPRTNAPHTIERIERALQEAKIRIDEFQAAEEQVKGIVKKLQPILPISFTTKRIEFVIPAQHAAQAYGVLKQLTTIEQEKWQQDGSWKGTISIPGGIEEELYDKMNKVTHGAAHSQVLTD